MKKYLEINTKSIAKFLGIEKFWILLYKKLPSFYKYNVNRRYGNKKEFVLKVKDVSILFSIEDYYSRTWIYKRCDFNRIHEENVINLLTKTLKSAKCFVDVGAHIGFYTFLTSKLMKSVNIFSFEMDKINFSLLKKNLKLNKSKNVLIYNLAISDSSGIVSYTRNSEQPDPTLTSAGIDLERDSVKTISIKAVTLDDFFKNIDTKPDVVKIDVEGAEMQVLSGMEKLIEHNNPKMFVEVHPERLLKFRSSVNEVISFLLERGYNIFEIEDMRKKSGGGHLRKIEKYNKLSINTMLYAYK